MGSFFGVEESLVSMQVRVWKVVGDGEQGEFSRSVLLIPLPEKRILKIIDNLNEYFVL